METSCISEVGSVEARWLNLTMPSFSGLAQCNFFVQGLVREHFVLPFSRSIRVVNQSSFHLVLPSAVMSVSQSSPPARCLKDLSSMECLPHCRLCTHFRCMLD